MVDPRDDGHGIDAWPVVGRGRTATILAVDATRVIKLFEPWVPAAWPECEATALRSLEAAGLPAPRLHRIVHLDGRTGLEIDRIDGPTLTARLRRRPWGAGGDGRRLADLQADIARVSAPSLPSYRARLIADIQAAPDLDIAIRDAALRGIDALPDGDALCHADLHPDNVLVGATGSLAIDWTSAARGDPAADAARTVLLLSVGDIPDARRLDRLAVGIIRRRIRDAFRARRVARGDVTDAAIGRWLLPIAVARTRERIPTDQPALGTLISRVVDRHA